MRGVGGGGGGPAPAIKGGGRPRVATRGRATPVVVVVGTVETAVRTPRKETLAQADFSTSPAAIRRCHRQTENGQGHSQLQSPHCFHNPFDAGTPRAVQHAHPSAKKNRARLHTELVPPCHPLTRRGFGNLPPRLPVESTRFLHFFEARLGQALSASSCQ